jgi:hypothetical protein
LFTLETTSEGNKLEGFIFLVSTCAGVDSATVMPSALDKSSPVTPALSFKATSISGFLVLITPSKYVLGLAPSSFVDS